MKKPTSNSKTAVLIFDHSIKQAASIQKLAPQIGSKGVNQILSLLNKQANSIAKSSDFEIFNFKAEGKIGFGEELFDAYQSIFDKGYDEVIAIGNDCPTLSKQDIQLTAQKLKSHPVVLGPAKDGGAYLIALKKGLFSKEAFLDLDWQNEHLLHSFENYCHAFDLNVFSLVEKSDMDTAEEFKSAFHLHFSFIDQLRSIVASYIQEIGSKIFSYFHQNYILTHSLRGPPVMIK